MRRILWGRSTSSNVMKVIWTLEELRLPYERIDVGGPFGKTDTPELVRIGQPFQRFARVIRRQHLPAGGVKTALFQMQVGDQQGALFEPRKLASKRRLPVATSCT